VGGKGEGEEAGGMGSDPRRRASVTVGEGVCMCVWGEGSEAESPWG
jgi:hypothetical protein